MTKVFLVQTKKEKDVSVSVKNALGLLGGINKFINL